MIFWGCIALLGFADSIKGDNWFTVIFFGVVAYLLFCPYF